MDFHKALQFLIDLQCNNHRNWFQENKERYQQSHDEFLDFVTRIIEQIASFDAGIQGVQAKDCVYRIYRDVRFSKNKEPYKTHFGANIAQGGKNAVRSGYYLHLQPDASFIGGGVYAPDSATLLALRKHIFHHPDEFQNILSKPQFSKLFPSLWGDKLKSAPKGFPKDCQAIELLKYKHYIVTTELENDFWTTGDPIRKAVGIFRIQYEFNSFLDEVFDDF
ncbi:MAG: DUF2461 domain-containing protein [Capnocytophaga sp.]|nr:DUF2461 domain-containing protein [Capnocytophaga sp.]